MRANAGPPGATTVMPAHPLATRPPARAQDPPGATRHTGRVAPGGCFRPGRPTGPVRAARPRTPEPLSQAGGTEALRGLVVLHRRLSTLATAHDSGPAAGGA